MYCSRNQAVLPLEIEKMLPENDPVFKLVEICEQLDYTKLETQFFLIAFAFNVEKLCNRTKSNRLGQSLFKENAS